MIITTRELQMFANVGYVLMLTLSSQREPNKEGDVFTVLRAFQLTHLLPRMQLTFNSFWRVYHPV